MTTIDQTFIDRRAALPSGRTPISELEFELVREIARRSRPRALSGRLSALLLLARGAGASSADLRYVAGSDVVTVRDAGTWIDFRRPGHEGQVPVTAEFATELRRLARHAGDSALIGDRGQSPPLPGAIPEHLTEHLLAQLCVHRPAALITVERLRRGWIVEQLCGAMPVRNFLHLADVPSLSVVRELSDFCPAVESTPSVVSRLAGGVVGPELFDLADWGLD
jgi:hypothetical protein